MAKMFTHEKVTKPRRNFFPLSYNYLTTLDAGEVIPVAIEEMLPGDTLKYSSEFIVRMQPTIAPILSKLNSRIEVFFVPSRILTDQFVPFIEGGAQNPTDSGEALDNRLITKFDWRVLLYNSLNRIRVGLTNDVPKGTIWDYLGLPIHNSLVSKYYDSEDEVDHGLPPTPVASDSDFFDSNFKISALPLLAYWRCWYDFYRDENIQYSWQNRYSSTEVESYTADQLFAPNGWSNILSSIGVGSDIANKNACYGFQLPFRRAWTKNDYFESVLLSRQQGVAPALPFTFSDVSLKMTSEYASPIVKKDVTQDLVGNMLQWQKVYSPVGSASHSFYTGLISDGNVAAPYFNGESGDNLFDFYAYSSEPAEAEKLRNFYFDFNKQGVSATSRWLSVSSFSALNADTKFSPYARANTSGMTGGASADDIRNVLAVQSFLEKSKRFGTRYNELVLAHFGVKTADYRLGRAEFLGSLKAPIAVSEIPQTSASPDSPSYGTGDTPQGNLAGRGVGANKGYIAKYTAPEHGYFVVLFSIMPVMDYIPQGYDRRFIKNSRFDWFWPSLAHLSERQVLNGELYFDGSELPDSDKNSLPFGYQGMYAEYRHRRNVTTCDMRDTFDYWSMSRKFDSRPEYNQQFVEAQPTKRIFAVQDEKGYILHMRHNVKTYRPIPVYAQPNDFGF